jgi:hypothetical protein
MIPSTLLLNRPVLPPRARACYRDLMSVVGLTPPALFTATITILLQGPLSKALSRRDPANRLLGRLSIPPPVGHTH